MPTQAVTAAREASSSARPQPLIAATAHPPSSPPARPVLLPCLLTAGLLYLCYFPAACGWLAWVALVPFLALVRSPARARAVYFSAWAGGLALYAPLLQWLRVADPRMYFTWAFLTLYCSLYFPLALYLVRRFDRRTRLPLVLTLPAVWTALEFFRVTFGTGFSWYLLGHTQHDFPHAIQIADVTGAYGVSFLVAAVNALLFEVLYARRWFRDLLIARTALPRWRPGTLLLQGIAVAAAVLGVLAYGGWRLGQDSFRPGPTVALIQGNVPQQIRNDTGEEAAETMTDHYFRLCDRSLRYRPDLIVWPETSYRGAWKAVAEGVPADRVPAEWKRHDDEARRSARYFARRWPTSTLIGVNTEILEVDGRPRCYNSAVLVNARGQTTGRYDKIHRVPLGEYVPLRDWLPWMDQLAPYDFEYSVSAGKENTRFQLSPEAPERACSFGVVICYEDTDPEVARAYGGGDGRPPADFVLNTSNDGWFDGTSEHEEHLAICRFRAVECRRSVARAVNMGVSALIDGNGRVLRPVAVVTDEGARVWKVDGCGEEAQALPAGQWREYKKVSGVLLATIPLDDRTSLYAHWGDWLPWSCWGLVVAAWVATVVRGRRVAVGGDG
jgi:apolipoprotein N-acyltransferase